tara:strand:- start:2462 stop:3637 length:1176 start_codon:yes stop_codon:yes gene_type:complete
MEMKRKTIAIDGRFILRKQRGMPLYVTTLCTLLPASMLNYNFVVLINTKFEHNEEPELYLERLNKISLQQNVAVVNIEAEDEKSWEQKKLPKYLTKSNIDLIHMPANRACCFTSVKQVVTLHDCMEWKYLNKIHSALPNSSWREKFYVFRKKLYVKFNYMYGIKHRAEKIITVSNFSKNDIAKTLRIKRSRVEVCYHGIPLEFSRINTKQDSHREGVLLLGGDSYQKNCELSIRAWANLPNKVRTKNKLTILGFSGNDDSPIIKTIEEMGIKNEVEVKKWVSSDELAEQFTSSRVFLFPSREEGFGFPLLQAMNAGTPVLISDAAVLRELAGNDYPFVGADDVKGATQLLNRFLADQDFWTSSSKAGRDRAAMFNWENSIVEHKKVLESLL